VSLGSTEGEEKVAESLLLLYSNHSTLKKLRQNVTINFRAVPESLDDDAITFSLRKNTIIIDDEP
jgi:hypothetical protein